jgi:phosphohistidine phosphatase
MKRLLLLRHAKAVASAPGGDVERELAPRGRKDAARMGAFLRSERLEPQIVLTSPARRTRETADLVSAAFARAPSIVANRALYLADPFAMLEEIRNTDPQVATLLVVGHNPGIGDLANLLAAAGDPHARTLMQSKFPTAALAAIELPIEVWQGAAFHDGTLQRFMTPRLLA